MAEIRKIEARFAPPKRKRVAAYCRVSVEKDAMLHSLANQVSYYQDLIRANPEWDFAGIYADAGISGTKADRPEFRRMVADCRAGRIDIVLTKSISRFARNTECLLGTVRELRGLGVDVFFEEQRMHSLSEDGELMLSLLAGFAEEEARSMSENVRWKVRKFFEEGRVYGIHDIFGYRAVGDRYEIEPAEAAVVRSIFDMYLVEGIGIHAIARRLNGSGIPSPQGREWQYCSVRWILNNPKYSGELLLGAFSGEMNAPHNKRNDGSYPMYHVTEDHPAIVTPAEFGEARRRLAGRRERAASGKGDNSSPFSGKVRCATCGKAYLRKKSRYRTYWVCSTMSVHSRKACPQTLSVREETLFSLACKAMGTEEFDEGRFRRDVESVTVHPDRNVVFAMADGSERAFRFDFRPRSESWTDGMKDEARRKWRERHDGKDDNED